jgi:hypothetical protein
MATCPNCGRFLDTNHQCRGVWRWHLRYWMTVALGGLCGVGIAAIVLAATFRGVSLGALSLGALLGGLVTLAYLHGEPSSR